LVVIFAFADLELDVALYQLRKQGEVVKLAPKAFDLLLYLIQHRTRVVSKAELLDQLWPGEHVTESVLHSNVAAVRKALQSERSLSKLIQTVHGRGYHFVAPVEESEEAAVAPRETGLFIGRQDVMGELRADLDQVFSGRGRVAMLVGEPGIGKTRTAEELADQARQRGALVAEGRCHEGEGVPAFWPWVQVLRDIVSELPGVRLREQLGAGAPDIAPLLPEIRQRLPDLPEPDSLEPPQARFRLFDSVSTFFRRTGRARPLVLFLDDLHWVDEPTLRLMHFLAREMRDSRVLLLGAYREAELRRQHPLAVVLGELAREPHFRRIPLRGLGESDVSRFIERVAGRDAPDALVRRIFELTEGNPFFICEMVRLLGAEGRLDAEGPQTPPSLGLPQGVLEVIGRRLDRLSDECQRVLTLAAVIGREFAVGVLQQTAGVPKDALLELLDEAAAARIVSDRASAGGSAMPLPLGHYVFSHALIREALYDELTGPQRVRLHRRVAEVLEAACGAAADSHLPELAHHFFQAAPGGDVERAVDYGVRAAEQSLEILAWEESVAHYERVLQVQELTVPADDARHGELTLGLAQALWRAGSYPRARQTFQQVIEIARRFGDGVLLARAVLGMGGWPQFRADEPPGGPADEYRALLEETLEQLGEEETALRARLLSRLAEQISMEARESYSQEAVALARESGDPDALFGALYSRLAALLGPDDVRRRLGVATELLDLAIRSGSKEKVFMARESRIRSLLALGDIPGADREIEACQELAEQLRLPIYRHSLSRFRMARALGDGRFDEAERLNQLILELGRRADDASADLLFAVMSGWLQHYRGELLPTLELIETLVDRVPFIGPVSWAFAAFLCAELDRPEPARRHFERVAANDLADVPRDEAWLITLAVASEACAYLGDRRRAQTLYELLLPYADLLVSHQHMRVYLGSVEYPLARLAATRGERERAEAHYRAAMESSQRIGARPHLARTQYHYARMLLDAETVSRDQLGRARELLARAEAAARELGMNHLVELARRSAGYSRSRDVSKSV
jgi:DNA-binding winged helix-turn-helix (wHTH) protein/tetratricopeptide (TPR) repeat protein